MIDYFNPNDFSTEGRMKAFESIGLDFASDYDIFDHVIIRDNPATRKKLIPRGRVIFLRTKSALNA